MNKTAEELNRYALEYLRKHGFSDKEAIDAYFSCKEEALRRVADMICGKELLAGLSRAVQNREHILIYGDYDADGVMGTAILAGGLARLNPGKIHYYINDRFTDGYSITEESMKKCLDSLPEVSCVLTCDNGITAADGMAEALRRGVAVFVTDHHGQSVRLPEGCLYVDEKSMDQMIKDAEDGIQPEYFCGAELARRVITELYALLGEADSYRGYLDSLYAYAGFATITDSVPMTAANHYVAKRGLSVMRTGFGVWGILAEVLRQKSAVDGETVGFFYGPMVNAGSRVTGSAYTALSVFLYAEEGNFAAAKKAAEELVELNNRRKTMCAEDDAAAYRMIEENDMQKDPFLFLYSEAFRPGINGLTAAHLVDRYGVPAAVLSPTDTDKTQYKGSARSREGFDLFTALTKYPGRIKAGGHPMAAGLTVSEDDLETVRKLLVKEAEGIVYSDEKEVDFCFSPSDLTLSVIEELQTAENDLAPFGPDLPPVQTALLVKDYRLFPINGKDGTPRHAKFVMPVLSGDGLKVEAVWWNKIREAEAAATEGKKLLLLGKPEVNRYGGRASIQLVVRGVRVLP